MTHEANQLNLSHVSPSGDARMVDVASKTITHREATASAVVQITPQVLDALMRGELPKGEAFGTARVAGIMAAKRTSEWIPLCHPLPLDWVQIDFRRPSPGELWILCMVKATARTGVEMEALTGAAAAALTVYDMVKAAERGAVIGPIRLEHKTGGKSGDFHSSSPTATAPKTGHRP